MRGALSETSGVCRAAEGLSLRVKGASRVPASQAGSTVLHHFLQEGPLDSHCPQLAFRVWESPLRVFPVSAGPRESTSGG